MLTTMLTELVEMLPALNVNVTVPVLVTNKPENVATPSTVVTVTGVVVAFNVPPLVSATVTTVFEGAVFPYRSNTATIGCMSKGAPTAAVGDGCWGITSKAGGPPTTVCTADVSVNPADASSFALASRLSRKV